MLWSHTLVGGMLDHNRDRPCEIEQRLHQMLASHSPPHIADLVYFFMPNRKAHLRDDVIIIATFPKSITNKNGRSAAHCLGDILPDMKESETVDFDDDSNATLFSCTNYKSCVNEYGYSCATILPLKLSKNSGYAALVALHSADAKKESVMVVSFSEQSASFHDELKTTGQLAAHFNLSDQEKLALKALARGRTTADLTEDLNLSLRSTELRLQSARKKLMARTSTEAVFKAVIYGILS